jgi:hypothetical protein
MEVEMKAPNRNNDTPHEAYKIHEIRSAMWLLLSIEDRMLTDPNIMYPSVNFN